MPDKLMHGMGAATLSMADRMSHRPSPRRRANGIRKRRVVLGYGGGGAIAAIEAADAGADVIVLEKKSCRSPRLQHQRVGGIFISPTDVEKAFQYVRPASATPFDDIMCRLWAAQTSTNKDYLKKLATVSASPRTWSGIGGAEFHDLPGADGISSWVLQSGMGAKC